MRDEEIVALYWRREEAALRETQQRYGRYLTGIAYHILADAGASEECVNDTYLKAWNAIPPHRPARLDTFLGRLARQTAIDGLRARGRQKRQGSQYALSLEELEDCVIGGGRPEDEADAHLLAEAIGGYLRGLKPEARTAFIERYYYFDPLKEIAARHGLGEAKLKSLLFRTRQGLKLWLEKEGFFV